MRKQFPKFFPVRSYLSNRPGHEPRVRHDHPEVEVDRAAEAALEKEVAKLDGGHGLQVQEDLLKLGRGGHGDGRIVDDDLSSRSSWIGKVETNKYTVQEGRLRNR